MKTAVKNLLKSIEIFSFPLIFNTGICGKKIKILWINFLDF